MATGTAEYLSNVYRRRAALLNVTAPASMERTVTEAKKYAVEFSSVTAYNPRIDKSRPYSRRAPHPSLPPQFINAQRGILRASWRTSVVREGGFVTGELYNVAPHSRFMAGTRTMIARPILAAVQKKERETKLFREAQAVRKALNIQ